MEVKNAQLCDGGYESELVYEVTPDKPGQCVKVNETVLEQSYHRTGLRTGTELARLSNRVERANRRYHSIRFDKFNFDNYVRI